MEIKTCSFIVASELFKDCPDAWQAFMDSDPPVTWGDAFRTLVSHESMTFMVRDCFSDDNQVAEQIDLVWNRLQKVDGVPVDLEN